MAQDGEWKMSVWVRNEFGLENDPTPGVRPAWETDYEQTTSLDGPRAAVVYVTSVDPETGTQTRGSGILIAPGLVLTASHVVEPGTGDESAVRWQGQTYEGIDDEQIRVYTDTSDLLTSDLALLRIEDTSISDDGLYGLVAFVNDPGTSADQLFSTPAGVTTRWTAAPERLGQDAT
jgi:V8-like Glu-specific endopeptidase